MSVKSLKSASTEAIAPVFKSAIDKAPYLSAEEEKALAIRWRDHQDKRAADRIIRAHLRLAIRMASKYFGYGLPIEDLVSEANVGLVKALENFDPDLGFRFSTYSMWWVRASLNDYVVYNTSLVKIGTTHQQKRLFFRLRRIKASLGAYADGDLKPDVVQMIAANLRTDPQTVIEINARISGEASLNVPAHSGGGDIIELIPDYADGQDVLCDRKICAKQHAQIIEQGMKDMPDRERDIFVRRKLTENPITLEQLSRIYGVTKERIRQIESLALRRFKSNTRTVIPRFAD